MTRINTNVASLRGLRSLNKAGGLLDTSLTRLSTGLKINSGKDNPSGLIASETLRSQISSIEQSIKNSGRANNVIATADSALGEVGNLLNQVRGLIQETLNSGAISQSEREANQLQVDAALSAINRISANTSFAGDKLIDGSKSFVTQTTAADAAKFSDFQINEALFSNTNTIKIEASITRAAERGELRFVGASLTESTAVEIAGAKGSQVIFLGSSSTKSNIRDSINAISDVTGVSANFDPGAVFTLGAEQGYADINGAAIYDTASIGATTTASITLNRAAAGTGGTTASPDIAVVFAAQSATFDSTIVTDGSGGSISLTKVGAGNTATTANPDIRIQFVATAGTQENLSISDGSGNTISFSAAVSGNNGTTAAPDVAISFVAPAATTDETTFSDGSANTINFARKGGGLGGTTAVPDVRIVFAATTALTQQLAVSVSAASTVRTITVHLGTDGTGAETSDYAAIIAAIQGNATATSLVTTTASLGTALGSAQATTTLTGAVNSALSVTVSGTGTNRQITVNLGADADGTVSSSYASIIAALQANSTANSLVIATTSAGTTVAASTGAAATLTGATNIALAVTISAASTVRTITVNLGASANGTETSSYSAIVSALAANSTINSLVIASTASSASVAGAVATTQLTGSTDSAIAFSVSGTGTSLRTVTVHLGTSAAGTVTSSYSAIVSAIRADSTVSTLLTATTNSGATVAITSSTATTLTGGRDVGSLKVTDNRNSGNGGSVATLGGEVFVRVADFATGTATASQSVTASVNAETGDITLNIQLAKTAGVVTSTIADVSSFINTSTSPVTINGSTVALSELITSSTRGDATTNLASASSASQLLGGNDGANNNLTFYDARAYGTQGQANVVFANPNTANQSLSISVASTNTSDHVITFNLATDANGNVTTTADDIRNLLQTGTDSGAVAARALVTLEVEGDGSEVIGDAVAQGSKEVDIASRILKLQSTDFGSAASVQLNVIAGSFETVRTDNVSKASRDIGADLQATINGQVVETRGLEAKIRTSTLDAELTFNEANNINGRRAVITITGGGSLFQIGQQANAAGQVGIGIEAVNTARLGGVSGKLYELGTGGGKSLLDISPDTPGSSLVNIVEEAINRVSTLRGRLGAIQRNVIDTNVNTLGVALENISEARSVITDTDFAETTADLTKAQILNQAGISVLSIANQNPQQVLSLLG